MENEESDMRCAGASVVRAASPAARIRRRAVLRLAVAHMRAAEEFISADLAGACSSDLYEGRREGSGRSCVSRHLPWLERHDA